MTWNIDRIPTPEDRPDVEQLMEYRDLMIDILHKQGKGIRQARVGEKARTRPGTEYMLPGGLTEWSIPDKKFRTHIERDRSYAASYRPMGERAARLLVLESDSVLVNPKTYGTKRNMYRFSWAPEVGVYEAEVLPIEIVSSANVDAEVHEAGPVGVREVLYLDHEHTVESDPDKEYQVYINPFREQQSPWDAVSAADFDGLLRRTDEYGYDLLAQLAADERTA